MHSELSVPMKTMKKVTYFGAIVIVFPLGNEKSADSRPTTVALYTSGLLLGFFKRTCSSNIKS